MDDELSEISLERLADLADDHALDELFDLLSDRYVRFTLRYLAVQPTTSLEQLADVVAGLEATADGTIVSPVERDRIRTRLYHVVLPKLDASNYVRFDTADLTVTREAVPSMAVALLDGPEHACNDGFAQ